MKVLPRNFIALFFSDIISRFLGFLAAIYIARLFGTQGLGLLSYGAAFLTYALLFANPGLTTIGAREIAKDPSGHGMIGNILGLRLVCTGVVFIVFALAVYLIPGQQGTKTIILAYLFSLFPLIFLLEFVFQGRQQIHFIGISRLLQYLVYVCLLYFLLRSQGDIYDVPVYFFFGHVFATVFLISVFLIKTPPLNISFSWKIWQKIMNSAMPIGFATIFNQAALYLPTVILGLFYTKSEVGLYSAAYKMVAMLLIIERVFHFVFFPVISHQYQNTREKLKRSFTVLVKIIFAITIPITICGFVVAGDIINFIYGTTFSESSTILRILLLYFLITPVNTIFGYGLVAIDQEQRFFKVITYTALLCTVLVFLLTYLLKAPGAALALLSSEVVGIVLMHHQLKKYVDFSTFRQTIKPVIAAAITGLLLYTFRQVHIILLVIFGLVVYLIIFYLIKGFAPKELSYFQRYLLKK
jgi:O-antigen/teichoic acid export membrane protein